MSIPNATMKIGDVVTVTITVSTDSDTYALGTSTVGGFSLSGLTKASDTSYTASFTVASGGTDVAAASDIPVSVVLNDSASNASTAFTTAISQNADRIDANRPVISAVSIPNATMKIGDVVTVTITVSSDADTYTLGTSTVGGFSLTGLSKASDTSYTASFTVTSGGTDVAAGSDIPVSVVLNDSASNANTAFTTAISQNADRIDASRPVISAVSIPNATMKIGDVLTVTIAVTSDTDTYTLGASTVGGFSLSGLSKSSNTSYTASFTVTSGGTDVAAGSDIPVSVVLNDTASNASTAFTTAISQSSDAIDANRPTVTDAKFSITGASGTSGAFKIGDTVTATWNNTSGSGDNNTDTISSVTVNFSAFGGGTSVSASNSSGTWTATYTIVAGSIDSTSLNASVTATDNAGNATTTSDSTNATVDNVAPTVTDAKISLSGGTGTGGIFQLGDSVTASWNNTTGADNNSDTISTVTVNFSAFGGGTAVSASNSSGTWTAAYTITTSSARGSNLNVSVTATDNAGNATTTSDSSNATVDNGGPTVTDANISISGASGTSGAFKIGDTVTATWNNTSSGDNNSSTVTGVSVDFSQFGGGSAVSASNSSGTWTATYAIVAGSVDAGNRNVAVTATNANTSTTTSDTSNATVDNVAATVTDAKISIGGASGTSGAFKTGDTVTATWNNTSSGDNNSDTISTVTVNFSTFGGGTSVSASNSSGTWTATYTIVAGSVDGTSLNVSVTATDNAGNTTTTSDSTNATVDNVAPTVTDAKISISTGSGTSGAFKIGDTVTATWSNTSSGDNNSDTISTVTVNFSAFGGGTAVSASNSSGTWTATYTIVAGSVDGTSLNVSVTATDNAGNSTTTSDSTNATVDNVAPTVTDAKISISTGGGTSGAFKIGDTVTATWRNTSSGDNNSDTISTVTVNFSAFGGGSAVSASNSSDTWTATFTIVAGSIDGTSLNVSVTATDNAGNATTTSDSTSATVDNVVPTVTDAKISLSGGTGTGGIFQLGDSVTASWNNTSGGDNNSDTISTVTVNFSAFGGGTAVSASNSGGTWTAAYTITTGSARGSNLNLSVTATDNAGNATTTSDSSNATVDTGGPTVTDANISISGASGTSGAFKIGDTVTATWNNTSIGDNNSSTVTGVSVDFSQFGGGSAVTASNSSGTWTATYAIVAGSIDAGNRNVAVTATNSNASTTTSDTSNATVDNIAPTVVEANISISGASGTGGAFKVGDTVTVSWNNSSTGDNNTDTISSVTVNLSAFGGGTAVSASNSSGTWTASYTIVTGSIDGTSLNVSVTATDNAGNTTTTSDSTNATVDNVAPTVTDAKIAISTGSGTSGAFKIGDTVTATWSNTSSGDNNSDTISTVTVNFSAFGGGTTVSASNSSGTWTASYTIVAGSVDATSLNVSVTATDNAGNATTTSDSTNATVDNVAPTVTDAKISITGASGTSGAFKIGDTVTATWNNTSGSGDNNTDTISSVTVNFSAFGGETAVSASNSSGTWTATYTIVAGSVDGTSLNVSVTATDNAGNTTTTSDSTNATVDNVAPTVTDAKLSISTGSGTSGVLKIGDTVTATWSNTSTGDNNTDTISTVTVNFSAFGGGTAVSASNSSDTWTATYTIVSGSVDGTSLNVSVTATDNAGNATTTSDSTNATADNVSPTVTDAKISISGASGTGGAYRVGDTVTATWSNTSGGDNNSDSISTVTVNFSAFGGGTAVSASNSSGTWTATLAVTEDGGGVIGASNLNIAVTATDNAGNATTTSDTSNATLDNHTPAAPTALDLTASSDSGSSSTDNLTNDSTPTFSGTAEAESPVELFHSGTTSMGTVTAGASGNWTFTAGTLADGTYSITAKAKDAAGNISAASSAISVTVDTGAPGISAIADQVISEDNSTGAVTITLSDALAAEVALTLASASSNTTLVPLANIVLGGTTASRTVTITPPANSNGTATITLTLTDPAGNSSSKALQVTVNAVNDAPSFVKGSGSTVLEDAGANTVAAWAASISAGATNESTQTLTFQVTNDNNALFSVQPAIASNGTLTYTPAANANGSATVTVILKDDGGTANGGVETSAAQTFTITVTAVNDAPTASLPASVSVNESTDLPVTGIVVSDVDGGEIATQLSVINGKVTVVLGAGVVISAGSNGSTSMKLTGPQNALNNVLATVTYRGALNFSGTETLSLVVTDASGVSATGSVSITVKSVVEQSAVINVGMFLRLEASGIVPVTGFVSGQPYATAATAMLKFSQYPEFDFVSFVNVPLYRDSGTLDGFQLPDLDVLLAASIGSGSEGLLRLDGARLKTTGYRYQSGQSNGVFGLSAAGGVLFPSGSGFSAVIGDDGSGGAAAQLAFNKDTGVLSLSAERLAVSVANVFVLRADGVTISYNPNGASDQTLVTIASAQLELSFAGGATAQVTNWVIRKNGFSLGNGTIVLPDIAVGSFLNLISTSLTLENVAYTRGGPLQGRFALASNMASMQFSEGGKSVFKLDFKDGADTDSYGVAGGYDLVSKVFSLTGDQGTLMIPGILEAAASNLTVMYDPNGAANQTVLAVASLKAKILPLSTELILAGLEVRRNGFSIANGSVELPDLVVGEILSVRSPTLLLKDINYTAGTLTAGTLGLAAEKATLAFDGGRGLSGEITDGLDADNFGIFGTFTLATQVFQITLDRMDLTIPGLLKASALNLAFTFDPNGTFDQVILSLSKLNASLIPLQTDFVLDRLTIRRNGFSIANMSVELPDLVIGDVLTVIKPTLLFQDINYTIGSLTAGALGLAAQIANIRFDGGAAFSCEIKDGSDLDGFGVVGIYSLGTRVFTLTIDQMDLTIPDVLTTSAVGIVFVYDPNGSLDQVVLSLANLKAKVIPLETDVVLAGLTVRKNGFFLVNGSVELPDFQLGNFLDVTGPTLTFDNIDYTKGQPLKGKFGLGAIKAIVYPGKPSTAIVSDGVDLDGLGILGTYDLVSKKFTLTIDQFKLTVPNVLVVDASGVTIQYIRGGPEDQTLAIIDFAQVTMLSLNMQGSVSGLEIKKNSFHFGSATIKYLGTVKAGNIFTLTGPAVTLTGFGVDYSAGASFDGGITLSADAVQVFPNSTAFTANGTRVSGTFYFVGTDYKGYSISVETFEANIASKLIFTGTNILFRSDPEPGQYVATFGSLGVELPGIGIGGVGGNFAFDRDGNFVPLENFFVRLTSGDASGSGFKWPSWLPIQITKLELRWPNITADATKFFIILSANVTGINGVPATVEGSVGDAVIDVDLLKNGKFPIIAIGSASITISGDLYGGTLSGTVFLGVIRMDAKGVIVPIEDFTTPIANYTFYGGIIAAYSMAGLSGFEIRIGLSELGPLNVFVQATIPVLVDPTSGLTLTDFRGGVAFNTELPKIEDPLLLRGSAFKPTGLMTAQEWQNGLTQAVINQIKAGEKFWDSFSQPMKIEGGATLYSQYTSPLVFRAEVDVAFDTKGKLLLNANLVYGDRLPMRAILYIDLAELANSRLKILMLADNPAETPVVTLRGVADFVFSRSDGKTPSLSNPADRFEIQLTGGVDFQVLSASATLEGKVVLSASPLPVPDTIDLKMEGELFVNILGQRVSLAGSAGAFHIRKVGDSLDVWGALLVMTNLDFLKRVGITASGSNVFRLNATGQDRSEILNVPGRTDPIRLNLPSHSMSFLLEGGLMFELLGTEWFGMAGVFSVEFTDAAVTIAADADLIVGNASKPMLSFGVQGLFQVSEDGVAGKLAADLSSEIPGSHDLALRGDVVIEFNTTSRAVTYSLPESASPVEGNRTINVRAGPSESPVSAVFFEIHVRQGELAFGDLAALTGEFRLLVTTQYLEGSAHGLLELRNGNQSLLAIPFQNSGSSCT